MGENNDKVDVPSLSRRDFLKVAGVGILGAMGGLGLGGLLSKGPDLINEELSTTTPESTPTPKLVDGVEVYGLNEKITSVGDVKRLYAYLDKQFAESNNIRITDKLRQRKEVLNPNERYLEVVVRRSAYDSFTKKQVETGVSFPKWIKIHVDVLNRCMRNAKPPAEMKVDLLRILVIDDDMAKELWEEKAYREGGGVALDVVWRNKFAPTYPIDTDQSWAIADDYRDSGGGIPWEIRHENGKTIMGVPPGKVPFERYWEFPEENDSILGNNNTTFDMGLVHEWSHYLLTLPDEYAQDVHDGSQRFKSFTFGTGSFHWPYFSAYLSYLTRANINLN